MIKCALLFFALPALLVCFSLCADAQSVSSSAEDSTSPRQDSETTARGKPTVNSPSTSAESAAKSKAEIQRRAAEAKRYYKLGVTHGQAKQFKDAAAAFLQAIRLKPDYADAYYGLGHAYSDMGRLEDAIKAFRKVVSLDPKDEQSYARLGELYEKLRAAENSTPGFQERSPTGENVGFDASTTRVSSSGAAKSAEVNNAALTAVYRVGIGDVLDVRLSDAPPEATTLFTITATGLLEYPLLDRPLKVVDLTPGEIGEKIKSELRRLAIREKPEVMVGVREYNSHTVLISGLVKDPGTKILRREGIPLYVVLADAQTLSDAARVTIISHLTGRTSVVELSDPKSTNLLIRPGDVITVQAARQQFLYVGGDVKFPGEKQFRTGLKLTQAILSAGGVTGRGKKIEVAREGPNGLLTITNYKLDEISSGKLTDPYVQAGDRITVLH